MKDKTLDNLNEVVKDHIEKVTTLPDGSEEKAKAIEELSAIHKLKIEEAKVKQTKWSQIAGYAVQGATIVGGWIFYKSVLRDEHFFEINNTPRTPTFRNLLSRMFPKF